MAPRDESRAFAESMVGCLTGPIIVWPGYEDCVPEKLKEDITMYRLLMEATEPGLATWPEVCAYMMTFSLAHPPTRDFVELYEYAFAKYMGENKVPIPTGSLKSYKAELSLYQEQELLRLRRWLWNKRQQVVKDRLRSARKESKQNTEEQELQVDELKGQQLNWF